MDLMQSMKLAAAGLKAQTGRMRVQLNSPETPP